jgi:hypothetical protein
MTNGFKAAVTTSNWKASNTLTGEDQQMKLPVVGYTGHRAAYRAQNFYGKNFRDCTIQSKMVEKMTQ